MSTKSTAPAGSSPKASWGQLKARLAGLDRSGLVGLVRDLYSASKENRDFLHARFDLGADPVDPYKAKIARWLYPNVYGGQQDYSVAKAKVAVSSYRRAVGSPLGLAELTVFFCEQASGFAADFGMDEASFYDALVGMFAQAVRAVAALDPDARSPFWGRLEAVRDQAQQFGYGVGDDIAQLWSTSGEMRAG